MNRTRKLTKAKMLGKLKRAATNVHVKSPEEHRSEARIRAKYRKRMPKARRQVVDKDGNPQELTDYQKRELYRKAVRLQKRIKEAMISYDQSWRPTKRNVDLMEKREHSPEIDRMKREYCDIMEAIGASDADLSIEKHRNRRS